MPLPFSAPMVRAVNEERKKQTRRLKGLHVINEDPGAWEWDRIQVGYRDGRPRYVFHSEGDPVGIACPYGAPGDFLWVRETWRPWSWHEGEPITVEYAAGGPRREISGRTLAEDDAISAWEERIWISLSEELNAKGVKCGEAGIYRWEGESPVRWRPSIHMPKWAARIWLRVTDVRVERLQEATDQDVIAEGFEWDLGAAARGTFRDLWDELNGPRGYGWDVNPWVWVVSFERAEAP